MRENPETFRKGGMSGVFKETYVIKAGKFYSVMTTVFSVSRTSSCTMFSFAFKTFKATFKKTFKNCLKSHISLRKEKNTNVHLECEKRHSFKMHFSPFL